MLVIGSKQLNNAIVKNKYQMQSIDNEVKAVANHISDNKQFYVALFFCRIDLNYDYSHIPLHPSVQKHCNVNIQDEKWQARLDLLVESTLYLTCQLLQKTHDRELKNLLDKFKLLDDILIITRVHVTEASIT